jgi:replicative DNA helicase
VRTTEAIRHSLHTADGHPNHRVPVAQALELPKADLPLDPYALGVWLAGGRADAPVVTTADAELVEHLRDCGLAVTAMGRALGAPPRYRLGFEAVGDDTAVDAARVLVRVGWCTRHAGVRVGVDPDDVRTRALHEGWLEPCARRPCRFAYVERRAVRRAGSVRSVLHGLGVLGGKHIPTAYLRASVKQRLALLQGLMDVAGTVVDHHGSVEVATADAALVAQIRELACSLGHDPGPIRQCRAHPSGSAWRFAWTAPEPVFRLAAKREGQRVVDRPTAAGRWRRIVAVEPVPSVPVQCITVDSPSHLYLAGPSMIPTHNTAFALGMAAHAAIEAQKPVLLFSLEMSQLELSQRLLCSESRVDSKNVRDGKLTEADWKKISHGVGRLAEAQLWIDDNPNTTVMEIRAKARRLKSRIGDLGLIIVDYLQLMTGRSSAENRQVEVSEISRGLKILARELQVPVVALSQLSRGLESRQDKRPMLADLRESGSIEQDADVVMFIYRDEVYHPETSDLGTAEIHVAKHRNGPTGVVRLAFLPHYTRFANMARNM